MGCSKGHHGNDEGCGPGGSSGNTTTQAEITFRDAKDANDVPLDRIRSDGKGPYADDGGTGAGEAKRVFLGSQANTGSIVLTSGSFSKRDLVLDFSVNGDRGKRESAGAALPLGPQQLLERRVVPQRLELELGV